MFEKGNKFYADWRTPDGVRHRKSFKTAAAATRHEVEQKRLNPIKAEQSEANSRRSFLPLGGEQKVTGGDWRQSRSSPSREPFNLQISALPTSKTPSTVTVSGPEPAGVKQTTASGSSSKRCQPWEPLTSPDLSASPLPKRPAKPGPPKTKLQLLRDARTLRSGS